MQRYNVLQRVPNNEPFSSSVCYDSLAYLRQTTGDGPILVAKIKNLSPRLRKEDALIQGPLGGAQTIAREDRNAMLKQAKRKKSVKCWCIAIFFVSLQS